jgi:hypothetical protein
VSTTISFFDTPSQTTSPAQVEIFDPPMCCPTGLCGPSLDQTLLDVSEMLITLKAANVTVERFQMASHPNVFIHNNEVMRLVRERQMDALPITLVNGTVVKVGVYPTLAEIQSALKEDAS